MKTQLGTRAHRRRRGTSAVELALILSFGMMTIVLGCVDFGRFAYNYIAVTNAARAGGSYAMMNNYSPSSLATWKAAVTQAARDEMMNQTGYSSANLSVTIPDPSTDANGLKRAQITTAYPFQTLFPWPGVPSTVTLRGKAQVRLIR